MFPISCRITVWSSRLRGFRAEKIGTVYYIGSFGQIRAYCSSKHLFFSSMYLLFNCMLWFICLYVLLHGSNYVSAYMIQDFNRSVLSNLSCSDPPQNIDSERLCSTWYQLQLQMKWLWAWMQILCSLLILHLMRWLFHCDTNQKHHEFWGRTLRFMIFLFLLSQYVFSISTQMLVQFVPLSSMASFSE